MTEGDKERTARDNVFAMGGRATIAAFWTRKVIEAASAKGVDTSMLFRLARIEPANADADLRLPESRHVGVWDAAMRAVRDPGFPIDVVRALRLDDYAVLGLASKTSPDLGAALETIARFLRVYTDAVTLAIDRGPRTIAVHVARAGERTVGRRAAVESSVAELAKALRDITQAKLPLRAAHFMHARPEDTSAHDAFLRAELRFGSSFDGLVLDRAAERIPLALSDESLCLYLRADLERRASTVDTEVQRVRRSVADALPNGEPSIAIIASQLGVGPRTLQRRLEGEGTTFKELVDEVRKDLAESLLGDRARSCAEIGFLLGFSEPAAFHRAFRRWHKTTPLRWRRAHEGGARR